MVGRSKVKIEPEHVVYIFMGGPRIIYEIVKIFQFIVIILLFYFILYKIQQLFSNMDS